MGDVYFRMLDAYHASNFEKLATLEAEATAIYRIMRENNSLIAGKEIMRHIGIDCGPVRRPLRNMKSAESATLLSQLQKTSFFDFALKEIKETRAVGK